MPIPAYLRIASRCAVLLLCFGAAAEHAQPPTTTTDMASGRPVVVLLHGLARSSASMRPMARALRRAGYAVCNIDYPSRRHDIAQLARHHVLPAIRTCVPDKNQTLHFVTHSMGGIVLRYLSTTESDLRIGRVVMLSPPNQGSEVVDELGHWRAFAWINGPAGSQLGSADSALPKQLGAVTFQLGVLTGNRSINWILSALIPGADDGKVSVVNAQIAGMRDFRILPVSHPFIMRHPIAIAQTLHFLEQGEFSVESAACSPHGLLCQQ